VYSILIIKVLVVNIILKEEQSFNHYLIASFNMLPIVLSGFLMIHAMKMMRVSQLFIIMMLFFIFVFSGDLLRVMLSPFSRLHELYKYAPSAQFDDNLMNYMEQTVQFEYSYWITAIVISVICLLIGARKFTKQPID